ncbi:MAG: FAD-dependent oxidoreductase [Kiloniellaceae bacterium]
MIDGAEIVVIGGGAIGCSIAYHLAKLGKRDVVVLEKSGLTHGATWHAAGLVGQLRSKRNLTRMLQDSVRLYGELEAETGQATDWKPVGSLRLASSQERWREIKRTATTARSFGFELHLLSPKEALELFPLMTTGGVVGAAYIPTDGYIDPSSLTQALAKGARQGGVRFLEGVRVTGFTVKDRRVGKVATDHGAIRAEVVVNAAGMWARDIGALAGVRVPAAAVEHQYLVTEKVIDAPADMPTLRDPDKTFYLKPEVGGVALGGWEHNPPPFGEDGIPPDFERELLASNFDRFEPIATQAAERIPILGEVGIRDLINGPIPVSPDGEPVMGPAPELDNFFVACGFTAGIAACGGAGRAMAQWIVEGDPGMDLWAFDIRRFGPHHAGKRVLHERAVESYGRYYSIHWPVEEMRSARGGRRSPLYPILKERGAVFGSKFGWERPNWFAPAGVEPVDRPSFERPNWLEHVANEHRAVRERVALIDQSSFAKFEVSGPGACRFLQWLAANDLDKPPGAVTYTQLCNARGGIEADLTVTRLAEDRFYVVTGSGFAVRDANWIESHMPRDGSVVLRDVTSSNAVINVCGPRSRALLERVADGDVSNAGLPFMQARSLRIGYAPALALRLTYVGELGWELHVPSEYAAHVYELLWRAGREFDAANVGYRAIDSLRMEKGYLYWGADITPDTNPYEAGLGFCVRLDKGDFLGRGALARIKAEGPKQKLCCLTLERPVPAFGGEAILRGGKVLGVTTSGNYGTTVGKTIVFGYIPAEEAGHENYEVEVFCEAVPARRHARALYDANRARILA